MSMQQMLEGQRPREGARDGWIWKNEPFSVRGLYRQLRTTQSEDPIRLDACREVWKQRLPYKVAIFAWIFARQRVLTRVRHRFLVSAGSVLCMLCGEHEEDCEHLFFKCPIAIKIWASQVPRLSQVPYFGLQYRGEEEVMTPNGEEDLR